MSDTAQHGETGVMPLTEFSRPRRFLLRMGIFLALVVGVLIFIAGPISTAFAVNPALNGLIAAVLLFGIFYNFRQVLALAPEIQWIETLQIREGMLAPPATAPLLLAPVAVLLAGRQGRLRLSAAASRSILDTLFTRLDESRDNSRYMIGLLIFLGYGLGLPVEVTVGVKVGP